MNSEKWKQKHYISHVDTNSWSRVAMTARLRSTQCSLCVFMCVCACVRGRRRTRADMHFTGHVGAKAWHTSWASVHFFSFFFWKQEKRTSNIDTISTSHIYTQIECTYILCSKWVHNSYSTSSLIHRFTSIHSSFASELGKEVPIVSRALKPPMKNNHHLFIRDRFTSHEWIVNLTIINFCLLWIACQHSFVSSCLFLLYTTRVPCTMCVIWRWSLNHFQMLIAYLLIIHCSTSRVPVSLHNQWANCRSVDQWFSKLAFRFVSFP